MRPMPSLTSMDAPPPPTTTATTAATTVSQTPAVVEPTAEQLVIVEKLLFFRNVFVENGFVQEAKQKVEELSAALKKLEETMAATKEQVDKAPNPMLKVCFFVFFISILFALHLLDSFIYTQPCI